MTRLSSPIKLITFLVCVTLAQTASAIPDAESLILATSKRLLTKADLTAPEHRKFASAFLQSKEWQHEFWDSGPVEQPVVAVKSLYRLWQLDPSMIDHRINRQMATALALETPIVKWDQSIIHERYDFFKTRFSEGRLNVAYNDLNVFERRYLARGVQHQHLNPVDSLEYLNDEVSLPAEKYTGACWYPRYLSDNPFGDSIHGPHYYKPFQDSWGSAAEMVRNVGGVCGSLSNFGAAAAIANGIPAATMGEPGHCAFVVRTEPGKWTPAYSLSWKRGLHTAFYNGTWGWHVLNTKAYQATDDARASGDIRRLTQHHLDTGNTGAALRAIRAARTRYPLDWSNWQLSVDTLIQTDAAISEWQTLHQDVIKHLAPVASEIAFYILDKYIYDQVLPTGKDAVHQRSNILRAFHWSFKDWGFGRWDFYNALSRQLQRLQGDSRINDQFMVDVFGIHANNNVFSPLILEEQLKIVGADERRRQQYIANISRNLKKDGDTDAYKNMVVSMATKVLPYAAKEGDRATFQFIGEMASEFYPPIEIKTDPFPGILLSSGGVFYIKKPGNRWDKPSQHWGVIEPHGGFFHTDHTPATATVQLGNFGRLSGVVIVTTNSHLQRMINARLEVSIDGQQWTAVHTFQKRQRVHRVDLRDQKIDAGYVRVVQPNHGSIHFNQFHVYGIKQN